MNDNNLENQNLNMNNNNEGSITPVVEPNPAVEVAPVVSEAPVVNPTPAVEVAPVVPETPVVNPTPAVEVAPVVFETPVVNPTPAVEVAPVAPEAPVVNPTPAVEVAPVVPEAPVVNVTPTVPVENVVPTNGSAVPPQNTNEVKDNKKLYLVIGGIVLIVLIVVILIFTVFKDGDKGGSDSYDDYVKEEQKNFEDLNKHFTYKEHKLSNGFLVEVNNDNKVPVYADVKIEFFDASEKLIDVYDSSISSIQAKGKSYLFVSTYDKEYSSYKIIVKLDKSLSTKIYNDSIELVSANPAPDDMYLFQLKNNADVKLDISVGLLFYKGDAIVGFSNSYVSDVLAGETTSEKAYVPYGEGYEHITYDRVDVVVLYAYDI